MDDLSILFDQNNIEESISISKLLKFGGISSLLDLLKTNESTGLDYKNNEDINSRIKEYGTNKTINYRARSFLSFLLIQFQDFVMILLIIVGSLSGKRLDTIFQAVSLGAAILTVILVGSLSDFHKERQFKRLYSKGDQPRINVIRNSETKTIFQNDLFVGDNNRNKFRGLFNY